MNTDSAPAPLIVLDQVVKTYPGPTGPGLSGLFHALAGIDLEIRCGEFVAVVGASGSGKSTLLNLLGGIDRASAGRIVIDGRDLGAASERELTVWRGRSIGIVFQFFQLLPTLTALENVMLPMDFAGIGSPRERRQRALALLERLRIADQADKLPASLSGGQQQRVAVARALANDPPILLADEPTGNLDSRTAEALLEGLSDLVDEGLTIVMVTHEPRAMAHASRAISLADGRIVPEARADA
ncbi:ABC transporter ATP-binding protein [Tahibacter sp.]|uniref:ABC transporter ATP-binding protein n=1 Tax=Tahibacter sp. TaxID=2056211 RepID=UPI0028C50A64|nr:ABC transporter ATP-binding protein [Tahibacter sp.]